MQVEEEKASLQSQCADQQNDLGSLRKELLQAEQTRLDLESDKVSFQEKIKFLEIEKEKVSAVCSKRAVIRNVMTYSVY
jgi:rootletin